MRIDEGVRELVVILNYNGIGTEASCWGHKNYGLPYPWVDINKDYLGDLFNIILDLDIETEDLGDTIRIKPKICRLISGRKEFNKLKEKLKLI